MPPVIKILGYSGLIPFIGFAILSILLTDNVLVVDAMALYAFGIFTFLCGAWWPTADMQGAKFWRILLSNVLFLTAFFAFLLLTNQWLIIGAVLYIVIWAIEQFSSFIPKASPPYSKMRTILTVVACVSMLITYLFGAV
jgi:hypothetical protein